ncbi:MAG TPA: alpha/beta hydrolase [Blastocatellia bacterium]|nr:alpha/beta hydrolase [Blastocatellia bacterium]
MRHLMNVIKLATVTGAILMIAGVAGAQEYVRIEGTTCTSTPYLHCPDSECSGPMVINEGNVVEMKTRRTYFLDYPCDLKKGEKVTFVLSLHGAGSYGNWQRNYFPIMDYKDKYRLVIATPNSPTRVWSEADDQYLQNIVNFVFDQIGRENIKSFWIVGHSQGGMTSNRLVRTDFFKDKVDGWLSLSGGRLGGNPGRGATFAPSGPPPGAAPGAAAPARPAGAAPAAGAPPGMSAAMAALREPPAIEMSFIYETGRREMDDKGLPETSEWAKKYNCGARTAAREIVDTKAGYVYDTSRLNQLRPGWGLMPAPGKAEVYQFPDCKDGRVVADVVRIDKGHTEGLEPKVTEELVKLMLSAKGGKLQQAQR